MGTMAHANLDFDNVAVSVTDLDRSLEWYERVLGFKVLYRTFSTAVNAELVVIHRDGARIELLLQDGARRNPDADIVPGPHLKTSGVKAIVFRTDDLEGITEYLESCNVTFDWKVRTLSADGLRSTMIRDPDGVLINVLSYPPSA
ncbi:VOC family protein [Amycolatopsis eburnea]|uniref:VOC family protein n=2 Tax=Amycolatopsis eburnea TaxID=2267691 RepID=A0A3R9KF52_9PSEU|nr:VOC family protein [Amycolatopsis eburnea]